jgi:hypothetical protein
VQSMQLYMDTSLAYSVGGQSLNKTLALAAGSHYIVIKAWDATGISWSSGENITVQCSLCGREILNDGRPRDFDADSFKP